MKFEVSNLVASQTGGLTAKLNLSLTAGETLGVSGPSGVGKSVLLNCLADLVPHQGDMFLDGESCLSMPAHVWRRRVCLLPAESYWWYVTVGEHFGARSITGGTSEGHKHPGSMTGFVNSASGPEQDCFTQLGFEPEVMQWRVDRLSTGEKQRLSLLRVLHNQPDVLLLDEPTASLDPVSTRKAEACIAHYQQRSSCVVIWVSHDPAQLRRVADRGLHLDKSGYSEPPL